MAIDEPSNTGDSNKVLAQGHPEYVDVTAENRNHRAQTILPQHGHNTSSQQDVRQNPDLALHFSHEHQHQHLHHSERAEAGRTDEVVYSKDTTFGKEHGSHVPEQVREDQQLHHGNHEKNNIMQDSEIGELGLVASDEEEPKKSRFSRYYRKYRIFVHLFIWLVFTGYVIDSLPCAYRDLTIYKLVDRRSDIAPLRSGLAHPISSILGHHSTDHLSPCTDHYHHQTNALDMEPQWSPDVQHDPTTSSNTTRSSRNDSRHLCRRLRDRGERR